MSITAPRRMRWGARTFIVGLMTVSLMSIAPLARADSNLDNQKKDKQNQIAANKATIAKNQDTLDAAEVALKASRQQLAVAQADLADKQSATKAAQAVDNQLAADLAAAQRYLATCEASVVAAQAAVVKGQADLAAQQDRIGLIAQTTAQQNTTLMSVAILFTDFDSAQMNNRVQWALTVFTASEHAMDVLRQMQLQLEADQAAATAAEQEAEAATAAVQKKKDAAAAHLAVTKKAQADAVAAQKTVAAQVAANQTAEADAQTALDQAKAEDAQLQSDLQKIEDQIKAEQEAAAKAGNQPDIAAPTSGTFFNRPVPGGIGSSFGMRFHPILHYWRMHWGVDLHAGCGTPIEAAADGKVMWASWNGGYGNFIRLDNGKIGGVNYGTGYAHLSKYAVKVGEQVTRGEVIGYVGTTGLSTGCHLHFEVYKNGSAVNPASYIGG